MSTAFVARFTPSLMSHEALEAIFVQREILVERLVALTRDSVLTASKHYTLLIGPRGIGKTHLMALLYHRLMAMTDLHEGMRLAWLREEEWGVTSFRELLWRIFTALSAEYHDTTLATQVQALYTLSPAEAQRQAEELLLAYCAQRPLVLLMENLDELFNELGEAGQRCFRAYLQEHPFCTIVATAQSLFNGVSRQQSPFYGFFRLYHLEELQLDDAVQLLIRIAQYEQQPALVAFLQQPRGRARVQALAHLGGGNHRVYVILAQFLTPESLEDLVEPVLSMLDDLTPYYQARLAWLSPQQRQMVTFLCECRGAVPVKDIAQHCFMSQQTAASQLKKLVQMGYVRSTTEGRESFYELREPLLRLGMEVKKHRGQPIRLFVEFLRLWYTPGELEARIELLRPHAMLDREYLLAALQPEEHAAALMSGGQGEKAPGTSGEASRHEDAIAVYDEVFSRYGDAAEPALQALVARALVNKGYRLGVLGRSAEELNAYEEVVARYGAAAELALQEAVAQALFNKGYRLGVLGYSAEAVSVYEGVVTRYGAETDVALQALVARALVGKGGILATLGQYDQALEAYDIALVYNPAEDISAVACHRRVIILFALHRWDDAFQALDDALSRFSQAYDQLAVIPVEASLYSLLSSIEAQAWAVRIAALLTCYRQHNVLAWLGQGLIRSIATLSSLMVSHTAAQTWRDLWQEYGAGEEALVIPLRLLDAAVRYLEKHDRRVLLRLPVEERKVLEQVLETRGGTTA